MNSRRWTLNIEKLGKITSAQVEISPFMLFVGDNNSGKSYLMMLISELYNIAFDLMYSSSESESYVNCNKWLRDKVKTKTSFFLNEDDCNLFVDWFNDILNNSKNSIIKEIFNKKNMTIGSMKISNYRSTEEVEIKFREDDFVISKNFIFPYGFNDSIIGTDEDSRKKEIRFGKIALSVIGYNILFSDSLPIVENSSNSIYLPTARSGFLLVYNSIRKDAQKLRFSFKENISEDMLPQPYINYINLVGMLKDDNKSKYYKIGCDIEKYIFNGTIKANTNSAKSITRISYQPKGSSDELTMGVSSSVITELTPLVLILKSSTIYKVLVIEEIESHLHPMLQAKLLQSLFKLVNSGLHIWLTTHSITVYQQLNNCIRLYNHPNKTNLMEKYNYEPDSIIDPNLMNIYQFIDEGENATVKKLELTDKGFPADSFNDYLNKIKRETLDFYTDID